MSRILYYGLNVNLRIHDYKINFRGQRILDPRSTAYELKGYDDFEKAKYALKDEAWDAVGVNMGAERAREFIRFARVAVNSPLIALAISDGDVGAACDALRINEMKRIKRVLRASISTRKNIETLIQILQTGKPETLC